jgi:hypothetical protein
VIDVINIEKDSKRLKPGGGNMFVSTAPNLTYDEGLNLAHRLTCVIILYVEIQSINPCIG